MQRRDQAEHWLTAIRRGDVDEVDKIVRYLESQVVARLHQRHSLTLTESCELARTAIADGWQRLSDGETPDELLPWLFAIADDLLGDWRRSSTPDPDHLAEPLPGPASAREALAAYATAPTDLARQRIVREHFPVFVEFAQDVLVDAPPRVRQGMGTLRWVLGRGPLDLARGSDRIDAIERLTHGLPEASHGAAALATAWELAGMELMARTRREDCPGFAAWLSAAGWTDGPLGAALHVRLRQHFDVCGQGTCQQSYAENIALAGALPFALLLLAVELDDRHRPLVAAMLGADDPRGGVEAIAGSGDEATAAFDVSWVAASAPLGVSRVAASAPGSASPAAVSALAATSLTARLAKLPWVRTVTGVTARNPQLAKYLRPGVLVPVAAAAVIAIGIGVVAAVSSTPSETDVHAAGVPASGQPAEPAPSGGQSPSGGQGGALPSALPPLTSSAGAGPLGSTGSSESATGSPAGGGSTHTTNQGTSPAGGGSAGWKGGPIGSPRSAEPLVLGVPAWGYAATQGDQHTQPVGTVIDLAQEWGTWLRSNDPALAARHAKMARAGTGRYLVRLPGLGPTAGVVHAELGSAGPAQQAASCQVAGMQRDGVDKIVDVACFDPAGAPKNLPFLIVYVGVSKGPTPMVAARYDTAGTVDVLAGSVHVTPTGAGRYTVEAVGSFTGHGFAKITPVGTVPARCRPAETTVAGGGLRIHVECDAPDGAAVQTGWALSYTEGVGMHHDPSAQAAYLATAGDPASPAIAPDRTWSSTGETPTVTRTGAGTYRVQYQQIGSPADAVAVTATGAPTRYCRNQAWNSTSGKLTIDISCFDPAGQPADATFALAYLRTP